MLKSLTLSPKPAAAGGILLLAAGALTAGFITRSGAAPLRHGFARHESGARQALQVARRSDDCSLNLLHAFTLTEEVPPASAVSELQAISASTANSPAYDSNGQLLPNVAICVQYGLYSAPLPAAANQGGYTPIYQNAPSWVVEYSGAGVAPVLAPSDHMSVDLIDGTTGKWEETFG